MYFSSKSTTISFVLTSCNAQYVFSDKIKLVKSNLNFHIYNELIYLLIKKYSKYKGVKKIFIVENCSIPFEAIPLDPSIGISKTDHLHSFLNQMLNGKQACATIQIMSNKYSISKLASYFYLIPLCLNLFFSIDIKGLW